MESFESLDFLPGLPSELGLQCLSRLPYTSQRLASGVCRLWRLLLRSSAFYQYQKTQGYTRKLACLVHSLLVAGEERKESVPGFFYGISVFDPATRAWKRIPPMERHRENGLPLFCRACGSEGKIIVMGGWDPVSYDPVTDVSIYHFATGRWTQGASMPEKRSFFAIASSEVSEGEIFIAGGHDGGKNALDSAWAYDPSSDTWRELGRMSRQRDECEGAIVGGEFWVVSGYATDSQGAFVATADAYDITTGTWRSVEDAWPEGKCPKACVGVVEGGLVRWGEAEADVRVGSCGVMLGSTILLCGSGYEGGPQGVFVAEYTSGRLGKLERVDPPSQFSGFIQSGSCVEI